MCFKCRILATGNETEKKSLAVSNLVRYHYIILKLLPLSHSYKIIFKYPCNNNATMFYVHSETLFAVTTQIV